MQDSSAFAEIGGRMTINERLKYFREFVKNETTLNFSLIMGISQNNYYAYENGNRGIPDDVYAKLSNIGCNLNWLIAGIGNEIGNILENSVNHKAKLSGKDCNECPFTQTVGFLTEQNKKLTDKLIERI